MRVGIGYDVHKLVAGNILTLGGIKISATHGLLGHSDADVLTHAIMDALLGAAALKDIGYQFPPEDNKYKNISSMILLEEVKKMITTKGFKIGNIDATILAEQPKLAPYIDKMRDIVSQTLEISPGQIMIKATTMEGLGFIGRKQGIAAYAIALLNE
jgi:2-C-methyl-D-erythritol 2,4-cyclodiphosphate synthase